MKQILIKQCFVSLYASVSTNYQIIPFGSKQKFKTFFVRFFLLLIFFATYTSSDHNAVLLKMKGKRGTEKNSIPSHASIESIIFHFELFYYNKLVIVFCFLPLYATEKPQKVLTISKQM